MHLWEGNGLNLDVDVLGESLDGDAAAGGLVAEVLLVLGVHLLLAHCQFPRFCDLVQEIAYSEVGHVGDEDHGLDDLGNGGAGLGEDSLEVLAALGGLGSDVAADKGAVSSQGNGARAVDGEGGLDGLGL